MGAVHEASLAALGHSVAVTPIIGKLRLHVQGYVDSEDFYIMPLEGCDVLLGMPWCHRVRAVVDTFNRKISLTHKGKSIVLDVKLKGESVPVVSASAISSVMKNHISAYLIFAKEKGDTRETNLGELDKVRDLSFSSSTRIAFPSLCQVLFRLKDLKIILLWRFQGLLLPIDHRTE